MTFTYAETTSQFLWTYNEENVLGVRILQQWSLSAVYILFWSFETSVNILRNQK